MLQKKSFLLASAIMYIYFNVPGCRTYGVTRCVALLYIQKWMNN